MDELHFCPKCGEETLIWDGEKKLSCKQCSFVLYHNCAAAVAVVIRCGNEIMLTKRNQEPGKGKLDLAGGFTDPKESAEETCARELKEELSIDINPENLKILLTLPNVYRYKDIDYNTLDIFFEYKVEEKFDVNLDINEVSEIKWLKEDEIDLNEIAFDSQKRFFQKYLNRNQ